MKDLKKSRIDTYHLAMYQIDLIVANKYATLEELQNLYTYSDDTPLDEELLKCLATTAICRKKEDGQVCILVKDNKETSIKSKNKYLDRLNTISHEATHVALRVYEIIDQQICFCSPEPFCYLQAYATECISKTLFNK